MAIIENILNPTVTEILSKKASWKSIADSIIRKGCQCQNFHLDHEFIIKAFRFPDDAPPLISWWDQEHQALHLLNGKLGSPITHGYVEFKYEGFTTIYLFREMVKGDILGDIGCTVLNREQCTEVGELLANIHNYNLVTSDCHLSNLLLNNEKRLCFIDFGNAEHYPKTGLAYGMRAARDLRKAEFKCVNLDPELSKLIENAYLSNVKKKLPSFLYKITRALAILHQNIRIFRRDNQMRTKDKIRAKEKLKPK